MRTPPAAIVLGLMLISVSGRAIENRAVASGRNDVVYLAPATEPYEGLPLGNGNLGAMVRNSDGMNYLFYPGNFFASADQNQLLISSGELTVHLPTEWMKGFVEERLALHDGCVVTRFKTAGGTHTITSWIAEGMDLLVVEIESSKALPDLQAELAAPSRLVPGAPAGLDPKTTAENGEAALTTVGLSKQRATSLLVQTLDGSIEPKTDGKKIEIGLPTGGKKKLTLIVANPVVRAKEVSAEDALKEARALSEKARKDGAHSLRKSHDAYWHAFWAKSSILMHSDDGFADYLENLYNLFLYWMAGMSRGPDAPKFNGGNYLFGNDWRSWGGCYWYQNTREMYWPLLPSDHAELWAPFIDLYWRHLPAARKLAKEMYDATGACYEETLNGFDGGGDKRGNAYTCLYLTTGTEVGHQLYQYYLYTRDETFLKDQAYPVMKETVAFHLNFLTKEADGLYHVYPSDARETYWWVRDSTTDLAALRGVLPILIAVSQKLGVDEKERTRWQDILDHLAPYVTDATTNVLLPATFLDTYPPTRFAKVEPVYSPERRTTKVKGNVFNCENVACEPIYPWGLVGIDSPPAELERMRNTFLKRPHYSWGFGNAWDPSGIWAARLGLVDEAVKCLNQYVQNVQMFPNGMAGTPGACPEIWGKQLGDSPAFDSSGVPAALLQEMQLQSYGGKIRVYPSWPKGWQSEFTLVAEGDFVVSSRIGRNGEIPSIEILSRQGGRCTVANPWKEAASLRTKAGNQPLKAAETFVFPTRAGESYTLTPSQAVAKIPPREAVRNAGPKWPYHTGPDDTAEAYLKRCRTFGFIGITTRGLNPSRNKVTRALEGKPADTPTVARPPKPSCLIGRTSQPPRIDGKTDDACWKDRPALGTFMLAGEKYATQEDTEVRLAYDDQALYLSAFCKESQMKDLAADVNVTDDSLRIFQSDSLEVYLQPEADGPYWHVAVAANGTKYDARVKGDSHDTSKHLDVKPAVTRQKDGWLLEMAIPFASLGVKPAPGASWRFNVGRNEKPSDEISTWAPLSKRAFHVPQEFGNLIFIESDRVPVAWFAFEGNTDEAVRDRSAFHWTGRFVQGARTAPGKIGQALELNNGAYFEVPHTPLLTMEGDFSLEAWVNPRNQGARVIDKCTAGTADGFTLDLHPANKVRWITPLATVSTPDAIPNGEWTHLAVTCSLRDRIQRIYVNGALKAEQKDIGAVPAFNARPLRFGADSNGSSNFQGSIDEVRIYRRVLTAEEIKESMAD